MLRLLNSPSHCLERISHIHPRGSLTMSLHLFLLVSNRGCPFPGPTNAPILVLPLLTVLHTVLMPKPMCHRDLSPSVDHTCRWLWPTWVAPAADLRHLQPVHDFLVNSASPLVTTVIFNSSSLFFSFSSPKIEFVLRCGFQLSSTSPSHWSFQLSAQHILGTNGACYTADCHTIHFWILPGPL